MPETISQPLLLTPTLSYTTSSLTQVSLDTLLTVIPLNRTFQDEGLYRRRHGAAWLCVSSSPHHEAPEGPSVRAARKHHGPAAAYSSTLTSSRRAPTSLSMFVASAKSTWESALRLTPRRCSRTAPTRQRRVTQLRSTTSSTLNVSYQQDHHISSSNREQTSPPLPLATPLKSSRSSWTLVAPISGSHPRTVAPSLAISTASMTTAIPPPTRRTAPILPSSMAQEVSRVTFPRTLSRLGT